MAFVRLDLNVKGVDVVNAAIEKYGKEAEKQVLAVLLENAKRIELKARSRAPKGKTGNLRRSIKSGIAKSQGPLAVRVYTGIRYAPYQEFGTGTGAKTYVPTLPTELQTLAKRYQRPPTENNPNITPKKFLWNAVIDQQPLIPKSIVKTLKILDLQ